ncbi:mCG1035670 [Mus musculus]|nr:mCG1035670 [Mus musculus]
MYEGQLCNLLPTEFILQMSCRNNGSPPFVVGHTGASCCPAQDDVNINLREGRWTSLEPNSSHCVCIEEIVSMCR